VRASANFYQSTDTGYGLLPSFPVRGIGTRVCYSPLDWKPAPGIVDGPVPQQRIEPASAGEVAQRRWSPNAIDLEARLRSPALLIINQNYETGWRTTHGQIGAYIAPESRFWPRAAVRSGGTPPVGLLAVSLPAGEHKLTLRHRPPGLAPGLILTILGIVLAVLIVRGATPARLASWRVRLMRRLFGRP
jgi:hypothetical protein